MQGTPNAERLIKLAKKYFAFSDDKYNRAYSICMGMKIVYANESEEVKVLHKEFKKAGRSKCRNDLGSSHNSRFERLRSDYPTLTCRGLRRSGLQHSNRGQRAALEELQKGTAAGRYIGHAVG